MAAGRANAARSCLVVQDQVERHVCCSHGISRRSRSHSVFRDVLVQVWGAIPRTVTVSSPLESSVWCAAAADATLMVAGREGQRADVGEMRCSDESLAVI